MVFACFDALLAHLRGGAPAAARPYHNANWRALHAHGRAFARISPQHLSRAAVPPADVARSPFFVTWTRVADARLRGCIGSLEARQLQQGLPEFALTRCVTR
jgi:AMMECR1 domain-containing protein